MEPLDPVLHQPSRTHIAAFLVGCGEATFGELKRALGISDGNLESHLKKLIAAGYVVVRKETGGGRPQSFYALTAPGQAALKAYVAAFQRLLNLAPEPGPAPVPMAWREKPG